MLHGSSPGKQAARLKMRRNTQEIIAFGNYDLRTLITAAVTHMRSHQYQYHLTCF